MAGKYVIIDNIRYKLQEVSRGHFAELVARNPNAQAIPQYVARTDEGLRLFPTDRKWNIVELDNGMLCVV